MNNPVYVGSCYLLRMLAIHMSTVSSCVWVRSGAEMLTETCFIIKYKCCQCVIPLSWCAGLKSVSEHGTDECVCIQDRGIKRK